MVEPVAKLYAVCYYIPFEKLSILMVEPAERNGRLYGWASAFIVIAIVKKTQQHQRVSLKIEKKERF